MATARPLADLSTVHDDDRRPGAARPFAELVTGSGAHLSVETRELLRTRLVAVSLILVVAIGLFAVRDMALGHLAPALRAGLVAAGLAAVIAVLRSGRPRSYTSLRLVELAVFGVVCGNSALGLYTELLQAHGDLVQAATVSKNITFSFYAVTVAYGMFIPNTWRRAATGAVALASVPLLLRLVLRLRHPELAPFYQGVASAEIVSGSAIMMFIAVLQAAYGAHAIHALRRQEFEARQLGQYQLRDKLGEGGMGAVYLAEHAMLKRPCAVKVIRPDRDTDPQALARFEREVHLTAELSHWNTVQVFDYGRTDDGVFYYVMEYLPGLNLEQLVERYGPLCPERAIHFLGQTADALAEAHRRGLIHRDIKPSNIHAARRGGVDDVAKLLDFGLVKPAAAPGDAGLTREGVLVGTPYYMPPEQATGSGEPDARSDIYALGAVGYFLLTGRPPFIGKDPLEIIIAHVSDPVEPLAKHRAGVPDDLEQVVLTCLAKQPEERYASADELFRALGACALAGAWTRERAAAWWREVEDSAMARF